MTTLTYESKGAVLLTAALARSRERMLASGEEFLEWTATEGWIVRNRKLSEDS